jgi:hypothetical protein
MSRRRDRGYHHRRGHLASCRSVVPVPWHAELADINNRGSSRCQLHTQVAASRPA